MVLVYGAIFGYLIIGAGVTAFGINTINQEKIKHGFIHRHTTY